MRYGKLIDGVLNSAPTSLVQDGYRVHNPPDEMYVAHGYLPIVYSERPEGSYEMRWVEKNGAITNEWFEVELPEPTPDPTEARLRALEEQLKAAKILLGVE